MLEIYLIGLVILLVGVIIYLYLQKPSIGDNCEPEINVDHSLFEITGFDGESYTKNIDPTIVNTPVRIYMAIKTVNVDVMSYLQYYESFITSVLIGIISAGAYYTSEIPKFLKYVIWSAISNDLISASTPIHVGAWESQDHTVVREYRPSTGDVCLAFGYVIDSDNNALADYKFVTIQ
jgi:hypothetical protein